MNLEFFVLIHQLLHETNSIEALELASYHIKMRNKRSYEILCLNSCRQFFGSYEILLLSYLEFLRNFEVMFVHENPEGLLPNFKSSINREDFFWLIPNIVQKLLHKFSAIFSCIVVIRKIEVTIISCVISTWFQGQLVIN